MRETTSRSRKVGDQMVEQIKRWIIAGHVKPGDRLPKEAELLDIFGLSKGTVREALKSLEVQGLVTMRTGPDGGATIAAVPFDRTFQLLQNFFFFREVDLAQIYELRRLLEPELVAGAVPHITEETLRLAYAPAFVLAVAIVAGGLIRLSIPLQTVPVKVGLVSIDQPDSKPLDATHEDPIWDAYFAGADRASAQGARVIVFTEAIALADSTRQGLLATRLSDAARRHAAYILAGVATQEGKLTRNRAWVFGPDGQQVASYAKHHLVPGFEASLVTPWNGYSTFQMDNKSIGVAICKDLDFPPLARRYGQLGVDALLIPAGDYDTDGWSHSRPAVLRGVENGFSIIRAAAHGRVTVADPYGRILAEAESRPAPGTVLVATGRRPRR